MNPLFHALNVSTLATWLSVAGFGTVGVLIHEERHAETAVAELGETLLEDADFTLGDAGTPDPNGAPAEPAPPEISESIPETLPAPPELPAISDFAPLPEIPELPAPAARPAETRNAAATQPSTRKTSTRMISSATRRNSASGQPGNAASGSTASGISDSARLAAGRMPPPTYPSEARRKGQTGTVTVEFTVDSSGRVISAYAKNASPWPLLNDEAVRTVRRWKFPPGGVMKLQRPIVFQLR